MGLGGHDAGNEEQRELGRASGSTSIGGDGPQQFRPA